MFHGYDLGSPALEIDVAFTCNEDVIFVLANPMIVALSVIMFIV